MHSVLVYHSISSPPEPMEADADISPSRFEHQVLFLTKDNIQCLTGHTAGCNRGSVLIRKIVTIASATGRWDLTA
jgi:hypothetical protein